MLVCGSGWSAAKGQREDSWRLFCTSGTFCRFQLVDVYGRVATPFLDLLAAELQNGLTSWADKQQIR